MLSGQPRQPVQVHPPWSMVGHSHHDHRRLRGHGPQDLPGHVRGGPMRPSRSTDHRSTRACHRVKLLYVLLTYAGKWLA